MKILICHNTYQIAGGEDTVVNAELDLLRSKGHPVSLYQVSNNDIQGPVKKVKAGLSAAYSNSARIRLQLHLRQVKPDVVHVHNFFPLLTPSIYDACFSEGVPVVQTLHNFRTICPSALLMRDNQVCELCIKGSPYHGTRHRCYRDSYLQSVAVSHMVSRHRKAGTWQNKVDAFIVLTEFAKSKFIEGGFPAEKLIVKPNFIADPAPQNTDIREDFVLFVGRLSKEKGIDLLCQAFASLNIPLKIVGNGPQREYLQKSYPQENIEFLGQRDKPRIYELMSKARFLVMPSIWYEGFPMVLLEAFAHGLPVLASDIGSLGEIIHNDKHGQLFQPGNVQELTRKSQWLFDNPTVCLQFGVNARSDFLQHYTSEANYQQIKHIYEKAINA